MTDLAARFVYSPLVSTSVKVVCLFCVLGLALSAVIVPLIAPEHLTWVLRTSMTLRLSSPQSRRTMA